MRRRGEGRAGGAGQGTTPEGCHRRSWTAGCPAACRQRWPSGCGCSRLLPETCPQLPGRDGQRRFRSAQDGLETKAASSSRNRPPGLPVLPFLIRTPSLLPPRPLSLGTSPIQGQFHSDDMSARAGPAGLPTQYPFPDSSCQ